MNGKDVILVNVVGVGLGIADIHMGLNIIAVSLAIVYTLWRWRRDYKKDK